MKSETKTCQNCKKEFTIDSEDFNFYEKIKVPPPTWCPDCRAERKMVYRNERSLYKRKCDQCGEEKILIYPRESKYKVYCFNCFYSDNWDAISYGVEYDFSKPFFEQYSHIFFNVPRLGIIKQGFHVNSEYVNRVSDARDCYLIFGSNEDENCLYGVSYWSSKDSIDCYNLRKSERCVECIDCYNCSNLRFSKECNSCVDSWFLNNCRNCQNCLGCVNLRSKNYCIYNKQYSREEYQKTLKELNFSNISSVFKMKEKIRDEFANHIVPAMVEHHSTNVSGNWIDNSKNIHVAYNCDNVEDGKYIFGISDSKDIVDLIYWGSGSELIYESINIGRQCSNVLFSNESWDQLVRAQYCINCFGCSDVFGCVGLQKKQYCIFNKQYSRQEYDKLIPKIINHMNTMPYVDKLGRVYKYGEFFPIDMAPFAYNESISQEYCPKTKEQALKEGYRWREPDMKTYVPTIEPDQLPDNIENVKDSILNEIISCVHQGKCNQQCTLAFKIVPNELAMYRLHKIPLPVLCPNCRHYERLLEREPIKLWHRFCMCTQDGHGHIDNCKNEFDTSYSPERPETVYCMDCYRKEVN